MNVRLFRQLHSQELISDAEMQCIEKQKTQPVPVRQDLLFVLYAGILLPVYGLGTLIYRNIDAIGHGVVAGVIAVLCAGCFIGGRKYTSGFSRSKTEPAHYVADYLVLPGALLLPLLAGYIQYAYQFFGERWGLATFVPMVLLFLAAYYYDHLGVLSLAVANLAAWLGITVAPLQMMEDNDFTNEKLIYTGVLLGCLLLLMAYASVQRNIKSHFADIYRNFGLHIFFISLTAGLFHFHFPFPAVMWFLFIGVACYLLATRALLINSYYLMVVTALYAYVGVSYMIIYSLCKTGNDDGAIFLILLYGVLSGIGLIMLLVHLHKKIKKDAGVQ
jgi:hypothetical protein